MKRSLDGTHHRVSREHLHRYLAQMDWLYTNRKDTDSERMRTLLGQVGGKRLTYRPVHGAEAETASATVAAPEPLLPPPNQIGSL